MNAFLGSELHSEKVEGQWEAVSATQMVFLTRDNRRLIGRAILSDSGQWMGELVNPILGGFASVYRVESMGQAQHEVTRGYKATRGDYIPYFDESLWRKVPGRVPTYVIPYDQRVVDASVLDITDTSKDIVACLSLKEVPACPAGSRAWYLTVPGQNAYQHAFFTRLLDAVLYTEDLLDRHAVKRPRLNRFSLAGVRIEKDDEYVGFFDHESRDIVAEAEPDKAGRWDWSAFGEDGDEFGESDTVEGAVSAMLGQLGFDPCEAEYPHVSQLLAERLLMRDLTEDELHNGGLELSKALRDNLAASWKMFKKLRKDRVPTIADIVDRFERLEGRPSGEPDAVAESSVIDYKSTNPPQRTEMILTKVKESDVYSDVRWRSERWEVEDDYGLGEYFVRVGNERTESRWYIDLIPEPVARLQYSEDTDDWSCTFALLGLPKVNLGKDYSRAVDAIETRLHAFFERADAAFEHAALPFSRATVPNNVYDAGVPGAGCADTWSVIQDEVARELPGYRSRYRAHTYAMQKYRAAGGSPSAYWTTLLKDQEEAEQAMRVAESSLWSSIEQNIFRQKRVEAAQAHRSAYDDIIDGELTEVGKEFFLDVCAGVDPMWMVFHYRMDPQDVADAYVELLRLRREVSLGSDDFSWAGRFGYAPGGMMAEHVLVHGERTPGDPWLRVADLTSGSEYYVERSRVTPLPIRGEKCVVRAAPEVFSAHQGKVAEVRCFEVSEGGQEINFTLNIGGSTVKNVPARALSAPASLGTLKESVQRLPGHLRTATIEKDFEDEAKKFVTEGAQAMPVQGLDELTAWAEEVAADFARRGIHFEAREVCTQQYDLAARMTTVQLVDGRIYRIVDLPSPFESAPLALGQEDWAERAERRFGSLVKEFSRKGWATSATDLQKLEDAFRMPDGGMLAFLAAYEQCMRTKMRAGDRHRPYDFAISDYDLVPRTPAVARAILREETLQEPARAELRRRLDHHDKTGEWLR